MSKIDEWSHAKGLLANAERWAALLGSSYRGGGGGIGSVANASTSFELYHQAYDGATNYHTAPKPLLPYLERAVVRNARLLIDEALVMMREDVAKAARAALAEADAIRADAVDPEPRP